MNKITPIKKTSSVVSDFYKTMMKSYVKHTLNYKELMQESSNINVTLLPYLYKGRMVATCSFFIDKTNPNGKPFYGSIHRISVLPSLRGNGLGTQVNKTALKYAKQINCQYVYSSAVINVEGAGGGNNPNLGELKICINKLDYMLTGFRLVDLPDFGRFADKQHTSTAVVWKPLNKHVNMTDYNIATKKLVSYYNNTKHFGMIRNWKKNSDLSEIKGKRPGVSIGISTEIEDFSGTPYLPTYFLPFYGPNKETVYFGYKYKIVLTRVSRGWNIADLNYPLLKRVIKNAEYINLSRDIQKQIIKRARIIYSNPIIKKKNI